MVGFGIGPGRRKVTLAIVDPQGGDAGRLEPRDKKGAQLTVVSDGTELATIAVTRVKTGFLGKARVCSVDLADETPQALRPLVLAIAIRYDAVLNAVIAASDREMDLQLPTVSGVDATRAIVRDSPHIKVLVLSASAEEADVLEAVKAGAAGYLLKSSTSDDVIDALVRVRSGKPVFTPSLAGLVLSEFRRIATRDPSEPGLTPRENEVLKLVAKGYTYREIGERLFISTKTVQNHVQNILDEAAAQEAL